jgi:uncharacterized protein YdaL
MDAKQFREAVQEMRGLQKEYFKKRDLSVLVSCKELEKQVDEYLAQFDREANSQAKLF